MTRKEYCLNNEAIACHNYYRMQIHGIEHGIDDYVYLSRLYQKTLCGATTVMFHKVKVRYDADGNAYINVTERNFDGKKHVISLALDGFIRVDSGWGCGVITCKELAAIA